MKNKLYYFVEKTLKKFDIYSPWPIYYPWVMSENEKKVFDQVIKNSKKYLEFGSGGSTIRALQKSKSKIYSIDSSEDWINFMRKYIIVNYFEGKRLNFFNVNIGKTKEWGFPVDDSSKHKFPSYSSRIFESSDLQNLDTIFVDGRFRVACTLSTIINVTNFDSKNVTILIHDFWNREYYHMVLNYLETVKKVDTLGVFKIKEKLDINNLKKDYEKFKFDFR